MAQPAEKRCAVCGASCAGKPRVKDSHGHYYCRPCYDAAAEKQRTARADREAAPDEESRLLAKLKAHARKKPQAPCPQCSASLAADAVLCVNCGYDLRAGQAISTAMVAEGEVPATTWPIVLGVIGIVWGGLGTVGNAFDVAITAAHYEDMTSGFRIGISIIALLISLTLTGGSILLIQRKPRAEYLLRMWARICIALFLVIAVPIVGLLIAGGAGAWEWLIVVAIGLVAGVIALTWPIFLLIWFRRETIRREVDAWE
jgi:hypothetical protein